MDPALGALLGAGIGAIISIMALNSQSSIAKEQQIQTRRTQRHEYLIRLMNDLILATYHVESLYGRFDTEEELKANKDAKENYASAMGRAAAVCLASGNAEMKQLQQKMTPYLVEDHRNINRDSLHRALELLADMIAKETSE